MRSLEAPQTSPHILLPHSFSFFYRRLCWFQCTTLTKSDGGKRGKQEKEKKRRRLHSIPGPHAFFHFRAQDHKQRLRSEPRRLITRHCFSGFLLTQILAQPLAASTVSTTHGRRPPLKVSTYGCPGSEPAAHKLHGAEATKPAEPQRSDSYTSAPTGGGLGGVKGG